MRFKHAYLLKTSYGLRSITNNSKVITLSISIFILLLFVDYYLSSISDVAIGFIQSTTGSVLFALVFAVSLVGSFIVINKILTIVNKRESIFSKYKRLLRIMQLILYVLSAILLFDIISESKYYTINLTLLTIFSYGFSIVLSLLVSSKLLSWYKESKNKFSLLFGISIFLIFINNLVSIFLFTSTLSEKPLEITPSTPVIFNFECNNDSLYCVFKQSVIAIQSYSMMAYFALLWICNYFLLHYQIKKIGKIKFFALITLPLVLFFFVFIYHYDEFYSLTEAMNFDESIVFMLQVFMLIFSTALCGILYGIGFKSVANLLKMSPKVENYLIMASYGIILFFITANATIVGASFPPFGIPSIIFLPFASLLFYVGVYYSIIAISNDIRVRKYIKNSTYKELEIMGNLAQSQMIDNMKEKVLAMTKKYSEEIHQSSESETMETEEDLKSYLDEAISIFNKGNKK
jgi:MFS family permease